MQKDLRSRIFYSSNVLTYPARVTRLSRENGPTRLTLEKHEKYLHRTEHPRYTER